MEARVKKLEDTVTLILDEIGMDSSYSSYRRWNSPPAPEAGMQDRVKRLEDTVKDIVTELGKEEKLAPKSRKRKKVEKKGTPTRLYASIFQSRRGRQPRRK